MDCASSSARALLVFDLLVSNLLVFGLSGSLVR